MKVKFQKRRQLMDEEQNKETIPASEELDDLVDMEEEELPPPESENEALEVNVGNIIGIGICLLQKYTHFIHLDPTDYYVSSVPIAIDWGILLLLNIAVILFVVIVEIIPTLLISHIRPSNSMRYE